MGLSIASFNLHNYNFDANKPSPDAFKKEKLARLVKIFGDGCFDIIVLQEVQTPETVNSIVRALNNGSPFGKFRGIHCFSFYEEISEGRLKSPDREKRGELAYIWNSEKLSLYKGEAVYRRLNDRLWLALDYFVNSVSSVLSVALAAGMFLPEKDSDDVQVDEADRKQRKRKTARKTVQGLATAGIAGAGYMAHKIVDAQLKRMRPPFVVFFHPKDGARVDKTRQIRLVNVHSQFGKVDGADWFVTPTQIRQAEAEFVLKDVFQSVKSEYADEGVDNPAAYVLACGDFNRSLGKLSEIAHDINNAVPRKTDEMKIAVGIRKEDVTDVQKDRGRTTIAVVNRDEVKKGKQRKYDYSHDYDHFAFDMDVWRVSDAKRVLDLTSKEFFVFDGPEHRAISDHLPISIVSEKL